MIAALDQFNNAFGVDAVLQQFRRYKQGRVPHVTPNRLLSLQWRADKVGHGRQRVELLCCHPVRGRVTGDNGAVGR